MVGDLGEVEVGEGEGVVVPVGGGEDDGALQVPALEG